MGLAIPAAAIFFFLSAMAIIIACQTVGCLLNIKYNNPPLPKPSIEKASISSPRVELIIKSTQAKL